MAVAKLAITLDKGLLRAVDRWVAQRRYQSRSHAIQAVLREKVVRWKRLAEELTRMDPKEERALAGERLAGET